MDGEDQATQDARVEKLWKELDTQQEGQLDIGGLKRGLAKVNHRGWKHSLSSGVSNVSLALKNADSLLKDVLKAVDTNGDGRIQYSGVFGAFEQSRRGLIDCLEFQKFVEATERELYQLFKSIDRDHNGQLDKDELRLAFQRASISLPGPKLDRFFAEVDSNHDGVISFDEWR